MISHILAQMSSLPRKSSMPVLRSGWLIRRKWSWNFFLMWKFSYEAFFIYSQNSREGKTAPFVNYPTLLVLLWKNREEQSQVLSSNSVIFLKTFSEQTFYTNLTIITDFELSIPALLPCLFFWSSQKCEKISVAFYWRAPSFHHSKETCGVQFIRGYPSGADFTRE